MEPFNSLEGTDELGEFGFELLLQLLSTLFPRGGGVPRSTRVLLPGRQIKVNLEESLAVTIAPEPLPKGHLGLQLAAAVAAFSGVAEELGTVVKIEGILPTEPSGTVGYEKRAEPRFQGSARSKYVAGPTRNRNERPCCSHGPAVLKTVADTSRH